MAFIGSPNLPEKAVCLVVIDERIGKAAEDKLNALGIAAIRLRSHNALYKAVSSHPDMLLHHIGDKTIVYAPGTDISLIAALSGHGFDMVMGESCLSPSYPADIAYNAARVGDCYFHNLKYTDPVIKKLLDKMGIEPVHVAQGYSKCSILPLGSRTIITTDAGIAKAAEKKGYDVLLVDYERSILLPGLDHGFIGGAAGMVSASLCAVNGSLTELDCQKDISSFFSKIGIEVISLSKGPVSDVGSILPLLTC